MRARPLSQSTALILGTLGSGLLVRLLHLGLPSGVVKYGGSGLWALMLYWIVSTLLPRQHSLMVALLTGTLATAVESIKLYHSPGLDAFRHTLAGVLLLGRIFSVQDIVVYWTAVAIGAVIDRLIRQTPFNIRQAPA